VEARPSIDPTVCSIQSMGSPSSKRFFDVFTRAPDDDLVCWPADRLHPRLNAILSGAGEVALGVRTDLSLAPMLFRVFWDYAEVLFDVTEHHGTLTSWSSFGTHPPPFRA
jgi:hypothetical protein